MGRQRSIDAIANRASETPLYDPLDRRICRDCEGPIPLKRLLANPHAVRCIGCQQIHEGDN
jgi:RNA polymerase-binding transcription factor DksA